MRKDKRTVEESPFLTVSEVAALLKISKQTVIRRLEDGGLPGISFGTPAKRLWRCRRDQIMRLGLGEEKQQ